MSKRLLFFDTETIGLPLVFDAPYYDTSCWPRVRSLAWLVCDENGKELERAYDLIYPDGWKIPKSKFFVENNVTVDLYEMAGIPMPEALDKFIDQLNICTALIAHNLPFDKGVISCEMFRYGKKPKGQVNKICTKQLSTNVCKIPGLPGKYKWPTLLEAYQHLFNRPFEGAHDAMVDVIACKEVYFKILALKELESIL